MNETEYSDRKNLHLVGGIAALTIAILFLLGIFKVSNLGDQQNAIGKDNFLTLIFKLHADFSGVQEQLLDKFSILDVVIIILVGIMAFALYPALKQVNRAGAIIAISMPIIGIVLYLITHEIGRTAIMPAGLAISIVMLFSDTFRKSIAYLGVVANTLLLIGDIGAIAYAKIFAISIGMGYVLFMIWCFLIARRLFQLRFSNH